MSDDWADVTPDLENANLGTEVGAQALERSLEMNGAGRSIVLAADGSTIAGNKTSKEAQRQGKKLKIVETDGDTLVAVKRLDIPSATSPQGKQLAQEDNRVGQLSLNWDMDQVGRDLKAGLTDLDGLWPDDVLDALKMPDLPSSADLFGDNGDMDPIGTPQAVAQAEVVDGATVDPAAPPREGMTRDERQYRFEFLLSYDDALIVRRAISENKLDSGATPEEWLSYMAVVYLRADDEKIPLEVFDDALES